MSSPAATELHVTGMTCNNCARKVTQAAQTVPGVHSVTVNLAAAQASVRWNTDADKNVSAILTAIAQAGFTAKELSRTALETRQSRWDWNLLVGLGVTGVLLVGEWLFGLAMQPWFQWCSLVLAGGVQVFCGAQFYQGAWRQLKVGQSSMDTLVALGSTTAFGYSTWALFTGTGGHVYFMEAAAIISLISFGHWLEARVSDQAGAALKSLLQLAPQTARKIVSASGGRVQAAPTRAVELRKLTFHTEPVVPPVATREVEVPVAELHPGDRVALSPGDQLPVDGTVEIGESAVAEAMLTGESAPVDKKVGSQLFAGTVNLNGRLVLRVTATGEATALANIIASVQRAQSSRAEIQRLGDRVSNLFVPVIVLVALGAGWWWGVAPASARQIHELLEPWLWHVHLPAGTAAGFMIAAGVLIIACPCAMGLATPAAIMASANAAARRGILIRDGVALEKAGRITAIVLDKTGTLTRGELTLAGVWTPADSPTSLPQAEAMAAALARPSSHPISKVIAGLSPAPIELEQWQEIAGAGVRAQWRVESKANQTVRLGSLTWLRDNGVAIPPGEPVVELWQTQGATVVGLAAENSVIALFGLRDSLKPNAAKVVFELQAQGFKTYLLTGDNFQTAAAIAKEAGILAEHIFAEARPGQKAEFVKALQAQGERVAFVGDGINDAPALTQADLGIAVSRASDIAREAADLILLKSDLEAVPEALGLARATLRVIKQNLFWAFVYNALGVPLAALGFISPIFCAAAMGGSDLIVIGNALRLLRWRHRGQR